MPLLLWTLLQTAGSGIGDFHADNTARSANRLGHKDRPAEPSSLAFDLARDCVPEEFLQRDISFDGARHLLSATREQLAPLKAAETRCMDATFPPVQQSLEQLFGVRVFVKWNDGSVKQLPLSLTLMSGKKKKDKKAMNAILRLLPECLAEKFVMDFGMVLWFETLSRRLKTHGYAFHRCLAVAAIQC